MEPEPRSRKASIRVTKDGPYAVSGSPPLSTRPDGGGPLASRELSKRGQAAGAVQRPKSGAKQLPQRVTIVTSFIEKLHEAAEARIAAPVDPWRLRLERVRGKVGDDGIKRISTQALFDHLEVLQRSRGAGASRHLAKVMRDLGWTPVRVRDMTRGGYLEQVRGYCRDARNSQLRRRA
jgi:hypothetical protein